LLADRLLVSLAPERVALARLRFNKLISKQNLESEKPIETLRATIIAFGKERMRATVVLSNRFVRYAVVPFEAAVSGAEEELALARFHFSRVHGEPAKGWDLRLSEGPAGAARIASAVDADLLAAIRGCFPSGSGTRLVSVQPYLMAAYNRWRDAIAREGAWLLLPETGGACLAYATRAGWLCARTFKFEEYSDTLLVENLEREQLRVATAPRAVLVAPRAALVHGALPPAPSGWKLSRLTLPALEGYSPQEDGAYAMALCAR
jgi:hypothetical protein